MTWALFSTGKSGKREVAVSLLMFWAFITGRHFFWVDAAVHTGQNEAWEMLTLVVLPWAAAAFGIDFIMKSKGSLLGPPSPSSPPPRRRRADTSTSPETVGGAL